MSDQHNPYAPPQSEVRDSQAPATVSLFLIRLIAIFMAATGVYWLYAGLSMWPDGFPSVIASVIPSAAAVGLWLRQRWSQYPVYLLSVLSVGLWCWQTWLALQEGRFPYPTLSATLIGLVISLLPLTVMVGSSAVAFRFFRAKS